MLNRLSGRRVPLTHDPKRQRRPMSHELNRPSGGVPADALGCEHKPFVDGESVDTARRLRSNAWRDNE